MSQARGAQETKAALAELIAELDRTRKEYAKSTLQVTHLETQLQSLQDEQIRQDQRLSHLTSELNSKTEAHKQMILSMEEDHKSKEMTWAHQLKALEVEAARLKSENEAMHRLERENRQYRETIMENQGVMERLQAINDDLKAKLKDESKDQAQYLEVEFKKRLAEAEKKFRSEAYRALSEEAKIALQGNDHLQTVLQRQNDSIEAVLLRCKTLEQSHAKIQQEQDQNVADLQSHVSEIQRLKKLLADAKHKGAMMDEAMKQRRVERASLELLFVEYEASRNQLTQAKEKYRRAMRETERWKTRAVQLAHELDDDQRDAVEAKLAAMQSQSDAIEAHLDKKRHRDAQHAKVRQSNAEGAAALRQAEALGDGYGSDGPSWEVGSESNEPAPGGSREGGTRRHRPVDPMEILAMWNVNFDSWQPPAGTLSASPDEMGGMDADLGDEFEMKQRSPPVAGQTTNMRHHQAHPPPLTVAQQSQEKSQRLSVLSQPRNTAFPPGARHFVKGGKKPLDLQRQGSMPPLMELSSVSRGEFKTVKKGGAVDGSQQRFLVP